MSIPPAKPNKPRLGRGLSSLLSISDLPVEAELPDPVPAPSTDASAAPAVGETRAATPRSTGTPTEIPIENIAPNPHQPRKHFDETGISALATSIKSTGLVQPIVVRPLPPQVNGVPHYQLIAGERRLRAVKAAGLQTIPAIVREVDPFAQAQMALIENIQREDLNVVDRALAYRALIKQLGLTQAELAGRLGEDRSSIANYLRLLELCEPAREYVKLGQLTLGHAKILAGVTDMVRQAELAETAVSQGLSVRNLERLLEAAAAPEPAKPETPKESAHIRDLEKTITSTLGMRVQLRSSAQKGKGKLVIHYSTLDQFDGLLERLGIRPE